MKLSPEEIGEKLEKLSDWKLKDEKWIEKRYRFREFPQGIAFVNQVAKVAENLNHHPLIAIDYKVVTLRLTTWHSGGLTDLDFVSAEKYDNIYHSAPWNPA